MSTINLNIKLNTKLLLIGLLIAAGVSTYAVKMKDAKAAVGISGLTGKYSCMGNRNFAPVMASIVNANTVAANFLVIIDFDAGTTSGIVFANSAWNTAQVTSSSLIGTGTFTVVAGPITGSYQAIETATINGSTVTSRINMIPSNSGNTLFYSGDSSTTTRPETGVCQKQ
jgi:hypothetical protein